MTINSIKHQLFVYTQLNDQTVLFQAISLSRSHLLAHNSYVKQVYLTHSSGATTPGQSGPGSDGNERVFHIPQSSSISVISSTHVRVVFTLCRDILLPQSTGLYEFVENNTHTHTDYIYIYSVCMCTLCVVLI